MTQAELADVLGVNRTNISNWEKQVSTPSIDQIQSIANHFGISIDRMLSEPLKNVNEIGNKNEVPDVTSSTPNPVHLTRDSRDFSTPNKVDTQENLLMTGEAPGVYGPNRRSTDDFRKLILPGITGKARTFRISGTSMLPTLKDGDVLVCVPAELDQVEDGKVYAVVDKELDINVKYAYPYLDGILMVPANRDEYRPIVIEKKQIREIWKAVLRLTSDLPDFGDIGAAQDLEKKIAQLEYFIRKMFPDYGEVDGDFGK